jgi:hypothetical protein
MRFVSGSRGFVRYSIYSGDPDGYFNIDPMTGVIRTASALDHEAHQSVLLNVQATSGNPPAYGHTQVSGCPFQILRVGQDVHIRTVEPRIRRIE